MKGFLRKLMFLGASSMFAFSLVNTEVMAAGAASIGVNDLRIKSGKVEINVPNETKQSFTKKFKGGSWENNNTYTWEDGEAEFNDDGTLVKVALKNSFTTSRGINNGTPLARLLSAYPKADEVENSDDGPAYIYKGKASGMECVTAFAVSGKTKKVLYAVIQVNRNAEESATEESAPTLKNSIGYYDGFTWGSVDQTEQLKVCKAVAIRFNNAGYPDFMGDEGEQKLWWVISKFYKDNGGNSGEFQKGLIDIAIQKFKIKDKAVIQKVKQEQ